jgi:hypothetical protein
MVKQEINFQLGSFEKINMFMVWPIFMNKKEYFLEVLCPFGEGMLPGKLSLRHIPAAPPVNGFALS